MLKDDKLNMIMEFADGTLDANKEDKLFLLLSSDEELKQQFKSHISIKNAIRASSGNVVVPASSKAAVFSSLSLNLPNPAGSASSTSNKTIWSAAAFSIAFVTLLFFFVNEKTNNNFIPINQKNNITQQTTKKVLPAVPHIISKSEVNKNTTSKQDLTYKKEKINATQYKNKKVDIENNKNISDDIDFVNKSDITYTNKSTNLKIQFNQHQFNSLNNTIYTPASSSILLNTNNALSLEFRGSHYKNTKKPTIDPMHYSPLNNMALALSYNINNKLSAGIDVRQETFFLRYNGTQNGEQFIYEQQPNFTTFSGTVKYKIDGWSGFRPFAYVSAGANSIGFVARAMLGAEYDLFGNFSVMLGFDFSNLTYTHQNNYFNSSKFGLNYGLIYSF